MKVNILLTFSVQRSRVSSSSGHWCISKLSYCSLSHKIIMSRYSHRLAVQCSSPNRDRCFSLTYISVISYFLRPRMKTTLFSTWESSLYQPNITIISKKIYFYRFLKIGLLIFARLRFFCRLQCMQVSSSWIGTNLQQRKQ